MQELNLIKIDKYFEALLINAGLSPWLSHLLNLIILTACIAIIALIANTIVKQIIIKVIKRWVDKSPNEYDDIFYEKGVFNRLSHLAPALLIIYLTPVAFGDYPSLLTIVKSLTSIYIIVVILMVVTATINALHDIYDKFPFGKNRSIKGYVQAVKSIIYVIGALLIISVLIRKDLSSLFAGLAAFAAVLMFVFKDTILGLVAGIQMSSNDILRVGDYIEMPSRNVDGTVIDITMSVVKVHNTNKTISTIPSYAFVSESFLNWRGLQISDGRRIKRFLNIDLNTIKYCKKDDLEKFKEVEILKSFFIKKESEPQDSGIEGALGSNSITNLTVFRAYVDAYLRHHPLINNKMSFVVRYLQATEHGLPLEIFVYTIEKDFYIYENIQADILDHLLAVLPEFGLRIFQDPSGSDVRP